MCSTSLSLSFNLSLSLSSWSRSSCPNLFHPIAVTQRLPELPPPPNVVPHILPESLSLSIVCPASSVKTKMLRPFLVAHLILPYYGMARSGVRELPDASFRQSIEVRPAQQLACYDVSLSIVRDRSQLQVLPDLRRLPIAVAQPLPASSGRSLGRHSHGTEAKRAGASTGSITARRNKVVKDATAERRAKGIWLGGQARGRDSPCTSPGGDKGGPAPHPSKALGCTHHNAQSSSQRADMNTHITHSAPRKEPT